MTFRTIACFLLVVASPALLCSDSRSRAAVVVSDLGHPWLDDSPMPPVDMPRAMFVPGPASNSASAGAHATRPRYSPPYLHRSSVPHTGSPYVPPTWASPWNHGYPTYRTPEYDRLPPVPTAPQYEGPRNPFDVQPHGQNMVPSLSRTPAYPVPQAPIRKPFSDYRPPPAISPYLYYNYYDPFDYYFFVRPLLEGQEVEQP